ncbi:Nicotinamidase-related amidase [Desulfacinum hydrothermale DSM 13146]|uniref:Nicotinamidase-related amidase n=1 Tax=Desulfacinum hydrothermale DSM 13146 TaxID=1121390 RepID=A0A1W1XHV9_9BACT|nr:isochorismatase family cysteine hydrolase [Desulfacinum hydrothermale]SMC23575.1 Nicotinamidase-related amidase [Desulfacinum hydrothermale DSM 13146]
MAEKALLVIDMLNDFVHPQGALTCGPPAQEIVEPIRELVERFAADDQGLIYVKDAHRPDDPEFQMFPPHAVRGTWGAQIIDALQPPPRARIVEKTRYSAFFNTPLDQILQEISPKEVWVCGVCTSICVMDTVGDLRNRDYPVVVPVRAVADFDPQFHRFALERMERVYGARLHP